MKRNIFSLLLGFLLLAPDVFAVCNEVVLVRPYVSDISGRDCLMIYWCDGRKVRRCWEPDVTVVKTEVNRPIGTVTVIYTVPSEREMPLCEEPGGLDTKLCRFWRTFKKTINLTELEEEEGCIDIEEVFRTAPREYYR